MNRNRFCSCYCFSTHSIDDYFTWIFLGFITILFYKTIKLCLICFFICLIIIWLAKQMNLPCLIKDYFENRKTFEKSNIEKDLPSNTNIDENKMISSNNDLIPIDNSDELINENLLENTSSSSSHQSKLKKLFIDHDITIGNQPKCLSFQPSLEMNSLMPRVPTKSSVITPEEIDHDDGKSFDNYIDTTKPRITTNEQFENITRQTEHQSDDILISKESIGDKPNWGYYSTKFDLFPNLIQTDLPIVQSDSQHLSLKRTILSHFHRHKKFSPSTVNSTSFNARIDRIQKFFYENTSLQYISNQTIKQQIFRVRKNRIIFSLDNYQSQMNILT